MRVSFAWLFAAFVVAACERAPSEDFARSGMPAVLPGASSIAPAAAPSAEVKPPMISEQWGTGGRCVQPTPRAAPPPVAPGPAPGCPEDPGGGSLNLPIVRVSSPDVSGVAVDAELVRSERDAARGLMYRKSLGEDRAMLFDLGIRDDHKFWMHNTCIPLDLLYIDEDGLIVGIVENAPTLDDQSRGVGCPSRWVLEVNAGWSRRHGVKAGQRVNLP
jgi:uncharacterized membrane protein (UPF0127 family)